MENNQSDVQYEFVKSLKKKLTYKMELECVCGNILIRLLKLK